MNHRMIYWMAGAGLSLVALRLVNLAQRGENPEMNLLRAAGLLIAAIVVAVVATVWFRRSRRNRDN